jgi:hypothetical protein
MFIGGRDKPWNELEGLWRGTVSKQLKSQPTSTMSRHPTKKKLGQDLESRLTQYTLLN